jgi:hypothetical protein
VNQVKKVLANQEPSTHGATAQPAGTMLSVVAPAAILDTIRRLKLAVNTKPLTAEQYRF